MVEGILRHRGIHIVCDWCQQIPNPRDQFNEKKVLRLALIDGEPCCVSDDAPSKEHFTFTLHRKTLNLGEFEFDQWWLDQKSIYPTRRRQAKNFDSLLSYWWQSCVSHQTNGDSAACESLLLACLFPKTRSNGSRRVMLDSVLKVGSKSERLEQLDLLENMLATSADDEKSILEFSRETGRMLGPPEFSQDVQEMYSEFVGDLLAPAVQQLQRGNLETALSLANKTWSTWHRKFLRRANKETEKLAIDMISYEARAAIHRCYAHAWDAIANWIGTEQRGSIKSFVFHRFWHLDLSWASNEYTDKSFHLFHGHILGLHPATGSFIQTPTGKKMLSAWLKVANPGWEFDSNPESIELRQLLNGLWVAVTDYAIRHYDSNFQRRSEMVQPSDSALDLTELATNSGSYRWRAKA
jgi:hypothetical protein